MNDEAHEKVEEARFILESLGFDSERSNERSALVALSLLGLRARDLWAQAAAPTLGARAIMEGYSGHFVEV
jgi:hypothetical protein